MLTDADAVLRKNADVMADFDAAMRRMQAVVDDLSNPAPALRMNATQQAMPPPEDPDDYADDEQAEAPFLRAIDWLVSAAIVLGLAWAAGAKF